MYKYVHIKLELGTTVGLTSTVHSSILETPCVVHKSQHSTKIQKVRADYTWMKVTCLYDAVKTTYKLAEGLRYTLHCLGQDCYYRSITECKDVQRSS
jgi:hypothetical protein